MSAETSKSDWGIAYRLVAAEKWKEKSAAMGREVTLALVDYARPMPGMHVLDVATGTGEPAISLSSRVGPNGHVVASDISADLLEVAENRARQRGRTNVTTRQADVHQLPFNNDSFDLVTCRFGVMFFADCHKSLSELLRVLKPGGRACLLAWGRFEQPYWASTMAIVAKHAGGPVLPPGGPNPFKFGGPGSLSSALREAGFTDVQEHTASVAWTWPGNPEEVWEYQKSVSVPFRPLLERVPAEKWEQVNAEVITAIRRYVENGHVEFGAEVVLASGSKPKG